MMPTFYPDAEFWEGDLVKISNHCVIKVNRDKVYKVVEVQEPKNIHKDYEYIIADISTGEVLQSLFWGYELMPAITPSVGGINRILIDGEFKDISNNKDEEKSEPKTIWV